MADLTTAYVTWLRNSPIEKSDILYCLLEPIQSVPQGHQRWSWWLCRLVVSTCCVYLFFLTTFYRLLTGGYSGMVSLFLTLSVRLNHRCPENLAFGEAAASYCKGSVIDALDLKAWLEFRFAECFRLWLAIISVRKKVDYWFCVSRFKIVYKLAPQWNIISKIW